MYFKLGTLLRLGNSAKSTLIYSLKGRGQSHVTWKVLGHSSLTGLLVEMPRNAFQWWTVHFDISDVFQRFLSHLDHLIRIRVMPPWHPWAFCRIQDGVQDGRHRNRNYWNDHIFFVTPPRNVLFVSIYTFCHPKNMMEWVSISISSFTKSKMAAGQLLAWTDQDKLSLVRVQP